MKTDKQISKEWNSVRDELESINEVINVRIKADLDISPELDIAKALANRLNALSWVLT